MRAHGRAGADVRGRRSARSASTADASEASGAGCVVPRPARAKAIVAARGWQQRRRLRLCAVLVAGVQVLRMLVGAQVGGAVHVRVVYAAGGAVDVGGVSGAVRGVAADAYDARQLFVGRRPLSRARNRTVVQCGRGQALRRRWGSRSEPAAGAAADTAVPGAAAADTAAAARTAPASPAVAPAAAVGVDVRPRPRPPPPAIAVAAGESKSADAVEKNARAPLSVAAGRRAGGADMPGAPPLRGAHELRLLRYPPHPHPPAEVKGHRRRRQAARCRRPRPTRWPSATRARSGWPRGSRSTPTRRRRPPQAAPCACPCLYLCPCLCA